MTIFSKMVFFIALSLGTVSQAIVYNFPQNELVIFQRKVDQYILTGDNHQLEHTEVRGLAALNYALSSALRLLRERPLNADRKKKAEYLIQYYIEPHDEGHNKKKRVLRKSLESIFNRLLQLYSHNEKVRNVLIHKLDQHDLWSPSHFEILNKISRNLEGFMMVRDAIHALKPRLSDTQLDFLSESIRKINPPTKLQLSSAVYLERASHDDYVYLFITLADEFAEALRLQRLDPILNFEIEEILKWGSWENRWLDWSEQELFRLWLLGNPTVRSAFEIAKAMSTHSAGKSLYFQVFAQNFEGLHWLKQNGTPNNSSQTCFSKGGNCRLVSTVKGPQRCAQIFSE